MNILGMFLGGILVLVGVVFGVISGVNLKYSFTDKEEMRNISSIFVSVLTIFVGAFIAVLL